MEMGDRLALVVSALLAARPGDRINALWIIRCVAGCSLRDAKEMLLALETEKRKIERAD